VTPAGPICLLLLAAQTPPPDLPEGFVGSETCRLCHEDLGGEFRFNPHFAIDRGASKEARSREWQGRACEACHGPGKAHMEAAEAKHIFLYGKSLRNRVAPAAGRINDQCLQCHAGGLTHNDRLLGAHGRNGVSCTQCHSVHRSDRRPLLAVEPNELCQQCHVNVRAEFARPYRHRVPEGAMGCTDCHDPHGELLPRQVRRVAANETVCLKCHGDKRGPFPFEHAPVRLGRCNTCHEPHGSMNPRLLVRHEQRFLCLECHTSSLQTIGITPPALHDLRSPRFQNCTICHSKIHGSLVNKDLLR
jgi:DmsE family decaheme c-type cytochrome